MSGELIIIAGPMRCDSAVFDQPSRPIGLLDAVEQAQQAPKRYGKTGAAIQLVWRAKDRGHKAICCYQPEANTRDGARLLAKSGESCSAYQEPDADSLRMIDLLTPGFVYAVVVEEAHLWSDPGALIAALAGALGRGIHVALIGVEIDHMREPFGWWPLAQSLAAGMAERGHRADVYQLSGTCQCGRRATRTFRHGLSNGRIHVEEVGHYESTCDVCGAICDEARRQRELAKPAAPEAVQVSVIGVFGGGA